MAHLVPRALHGLLGAVVASMPRHQEVLRFRGRALHQILQHEAVDAEGDGRVVGIVDVDALHAALEPNQGRAAEGRAPAQREVDGIDLRVDIRVSGRKVTTVSNEVTASATLFFLFFCFFWLSPGVGNGPVYSWHLASPVQRPLWPLPWQYGLTPGRIMAAPLKPAPLRWRNEPST